MLAVVLVPLVAAPDSETEASVSEKHTVVYHPYYGSAPEVDSDSGGAFNTSGTYKDVEVTYTGSFVSTEYNPQVWMLGTDGSESSSPTRWYPITSHGYSDAGEAHHGGGTIVFTGWAYATAFTEDEQGWTTTSVTSSTFYPGEVLSEADMEKATGPDGKIHIYATWGRMVNYRDDISTVGGNDGIFNPDRWNSGGNEYTNIVVIKDSQRLGDLSQSDGVTIRGINDGSVLQVWSRNWIGRYNYSVELAQDVIIDSIKVDGQYTPNHGDHGEGILANGHVLILGTGVSPYSPSASLDGNPVRGYIQIFGGSASGSISSSISRVRLENRS